MTGFTDSRTRITDSRTRITDSRTHFTEFRTHFTEFRDLPHASLLSDPQNTVSVIIRCKTS